MTTAIRDVIVVGGGISGLATAHHLKKAGIDVCLIEANQKVGGCIQTEKRDGFLLEKGPFNIIVREPAFEALLEDMFDDVTLVSASPSARVRYIYHRNTLHAVPTNPIALATTKLLTPMGRARLLLGIIASRRAENANETIEQVASRRFGPQVADTLVSSVIAGIFAGDISRLSLASCFPAVATIDANHTSLLLYGLSSALRRKKKRPRWRGLVSLDGGLGTLTRAMGKRLGDALLTNHTVQAIRKIDGGYELDSRNDRNEIYSSRCRHLAIGSSPAHASELLDPLLPAASRLLNSIKSASLAVINLGFRTNDVGHPMKGFGFLVPRTESHYPIMGVLWADSIFPHHAPPHHRLMRVFVGGAHNPKAVDQSDETLLKTALDSLRDVLDLRRDPVLVDVARYRSAIPQYELNHNEKIKQLRKTVATLPGLHLVGNYLEGVSVNDCVKVGTELASELIGSCKISQD